MACKHDPQITYELVPIQPVLVPIQKVKRQPYFHLPMVVPPCLREKLSDCWRAHTFILTIHIVETKFKIV